MTLRSIIGTICFVVMGFISQAATFAADGDLDTTFDTDGMVHTNISEMNPGSGNAVARQSDGKIVVAGSSLNGGDYDVAVVRYNTNGSLDTSFDTDGKVTTDIGSGNDQAYGVAIQSDGKIVVAGSSLNGGDYDVAVVRYNTDGSLDTSFDTDGKVTTDIGSSDDYGFGVAIQSDGKIVVAGYSWNVSNEDVAVVRYNTDGSLDTSFDTDGKVTTAIGSGNDQAYSVAIQSDGKIVVAGFSYNGDDYDNDNDVAVVRYNTDGSLDTSFDTDGKVTTAIGSMDDRANSVAIQSDGKIVVAGSSNNDVAVVRYNTDGTLDTAFDTDGKVTTDVGIGSSYDQAYGVAIQSGGKIVVAGQSYNGSSGLDVAVVRYNTDGTLDTSFDTDGKVTTAIGSSADVANSVAIQSGGKIVVAGSSLNGGNYDVAVVRYNADGSLDMSFDTDGKVTTAIGSDHDRAYGVAIQSDGKIVVAGSSLNGGNYDIAVVRYQSGSLTYVELVSFTGEVNEENTVTLAWETATEVENAGFNLYRSRIKNGNYKKLNSFLIPSEGNEVEGSSYSYEDTPPASSTYYYKLEDVDYDETGTMHGPVKVRVKK